MGVDKIKEIVNRPESHSYWEQVTEKSRESKIEFCYYVSKLLGEETECLFEDMLPENLQKAYEYCVEAEYKLLNE